MKGKKIMNIIEMMFAEDCLKKEKIENFIKILTNSDNPNGADFQLECLTSVGLKPSDLSTEEWLEVERKINNLF